MGIVVTLNVIEAVTYIDEVIGFLEAGAISAREVDDNLHHILHNAASLVEVVRP